jgi:hypothetical protein
MMEIELNDNILIQCPEREFAFRKAKFCFLCPHYKGIARATENGKPIEGDNPDLMQVVCGRPVTRKLMKLEDD